MKITVALGGNALIQPGQRGTYDEQFVNILTACSQMAELAREHQLIITHGNGPQVGNLQLQFELSEKEIPSMPLHVSGAMTQGQIGYLIQQQLKSLMLKNNIIKEIVTLVTQVVVDSEDPAFLNPTKPIGSFYSQAEALEMMRKNEGQLWKEDSGRGWRKVVPSPVPQRFVEETVIKDLVNQSTIVIASGGGGVPVVFENGVYKGIEAVVDKDLAGELLAEITDSDVLLILTDVSHVAVNYRQPNEKKIGEISVEDMLKLEENGYFAAGSMGPKVRAAIKFARKHGKRAIITSLDSAVEALNGIAGTHVVTGPVNCRT